MGYHNDLARQFFADGRMEGPNWDDGSDTVTVELSQNDIEFIRESLVRRFVQIKKNRAEIIHAYRSLQD